MRHNIFVALILSLSVYANAETTSTLTYTFDFAEPTSLTPSIAEPAVKEGVSVRDITFTEGPIAISFTENPSSNTHVRIFHSYNAGCDLRIYDGESMHITLTDPGYTLSSIAFEMSLTGTASDIDFSPSVGTYVWEENLWHSDDDEDATALTLTSVLQSRTTKMTVTLNSVTGIDKISEAEATDDIYYDLQGRAISGRPAEPGVYIHHGKTIRL